MSVGGRRGGEAMTDRERFLACLLGGPTDRPPYWLFWGPWETTWQRWRREGMLERFASYGDVRRHFGAESPPAGLDVNCGPCPRIERRVLEETDRFVVATDGWGIKRRDFKGHTSMPEFVEFPVKSRADWERFRAERLDPDDPRRLDGDWRRQAGEWMRRGVPVQLGYYPDVGIYGSVRWLLGDEEWWHSGRDSCIGGEAEDVRHAAAGGVSRSPAEEKGERPCLRK